jgi:hypothetical protein
MQLAILIIQVLLKYGPDAYKAAVTLISKDTPPTPEEWAALTATVDHPLHDPVVGSKTP